MSADGDSATNNIQPNDPVVNNEELDLSPQGASHDMTARELAEAAENDFPIIVTDQDDEKNTSIVTVDDDDDDSIVQSGDPEDDQIIEEDEDEEPGAMTLVEHLSELRDRLARCLLYVACSFGIALYFGKRIIEFLERPAGGMKFQALSIEEPLIVFFKVTFYAAIVIASPFILFEVSRFIAPGLTRKEKQIVTPALVGGPVLFVCGAAFAYYCLLPSMFHFFNSFGTGIAPIHQRLDFYMSLVASILLYMGLCFQLPIVIFALSFTGLVNSDQLIKFWRYAVFGASLVALVITPDPTAFSMLIVMGALVGLYAISVLLLKIFGR
jgi:sec-independent protein translocase protein TatC